MGVMVVKVHEGLAGDSGGIKWGPEPKMGLEPGVDASSSRSGWTLRTPSPPARSDRSGPVRGDPTVGRGPDGASLPTGGRVVRVGLRGAGGARCRSLRGAGRRKTGVPPSPAESMIGRYVSVMPAWRAASLGVRGVYRCSVTPTCRHIESSGQVEHLGLTPVQTNLPNGTNRSLISIQ